MKIVLDIPSEFIRAIEPLEFRPWLVQAMRSDYIRYKRRSVQTNEADDTLLAKQEAEQAARTARLLAERAADDEVESALEGVSIA
jgi:DNA-directed RNA polymerase specialized sigma24 family protein